MRPQRNIAYPYFFLRHVDQKQDRATSILALIPLEEAEAAEIASMAAYSNLNPEEWKSQEKARDRLLDKAARGRPIQKYEVLGPATVDTIWRKEADGYGPISTDELKQLVSRHRNKTTQTNPNRQPWE